MVSEYKKYVLNKNKVMCYLGDVVKCRKKSFNIPNELIDNAIGIS